MHLEALPAEIRRQILFSSEYEALRALVHASPIYHQQYLPDRYHLLCKCLVTALGSPTMAVDAYAVKVTGSTGRLQARTPRKVYKFLEVFQSCHPSCAVLSVEGLPLDEVISMLVFHFSIIKPLVSYYSGREIDCLAESPRPLSNTEETRIVRALYHFQLYCNLFGVGRYKPVSVRRLNFEPDDIMRLFLNVFEPWEVEEMACIHNFARWEVNRVFRRVSLDVYKNSKLDIAAKDPLLEGTTSRGLELLHTILFKTKDHAQLVSIMQEQISSPQGHSIEHVLYTAQGLRPSDPTLKRQQERGPTPFQGDHPDLPPLAWTMIWQAICSNHRDWCKGGLRYWGYVMWDAVRLERTRGKKRLIENWEEYLLIYSLGDHDTLMRLRARG